MNISQQQQHAVEYKGTPTLVIAGAGSGKTRTLTSKIAHLINQGYEPERILAITFTNKAANEMKNRLVYMTNLPIKKFPWVRTYHSACYQILKTFCHIIGYKMPLQIYTAYQQQKIVKEIISRLNLDKKYVPIISYQISNAKNSGNPIEYIDKKPKIANIRLIDVYKEYEEELKSKNAVDFDNILLLTRDILRDNELIRKRYQDLFQFVLVDEYQDTNNLQEDLTRLLVNNGNLFCVGDDWQAIYGFRGSNLSHFLSFENKYTNSKIYKLEENFRSFNEIVQIANRLISYNEHKMEKKCFSSKKGGIVEIHSLYDEYKEAKWVAEKIKVLNEMGIPYSKMAVLYRTKFCSLPYEQTFRSFTVPYKILDSKGFFERREVLDIHCYLISSIFSNDDVSFERIINAPKRGIGPAMIEKIEEFKKLNDVSLQNAVRKLIIEKNKIFSPKIHEAMNNLILLLDEIKSMKPDDAIRKVIQCVDYMEYLKQYSDDKVDITSREENLQQLIYLASLKDTIEEYLEESALVIEDNEDSDDDKKIQKGVNLSTIHGSKGLEFSVVFVIGCEEQLLPHWKSLDDKIGIEEERRLLYVAITRAESHLFISSAKYRKGQFVYQSRFLKEIQKKRQSLIKSNF